MPPAIIPNYFSLHESVWQLICEHIYDAIRRITIFIYNLTNRNIKLNLTEYPNLMTASLTLLLATRH